MVSVRYRDRPILYSRVSESVSGAKKWYRNNTSVKCACHFVYLVWTPLMVKLEIAEQLLQVAVKWLREFLCGIMDMMTGVSISIQQVGTMLVDPGLEAGLAAPHYSTRVHQQTDKVLPRDVLHHHLPIVFMVIANQHGEETEGV